jgi:DNA-binding transcriptional MerR regulator
MSARVSRESYRIGEVAALTGVTVEALRYYERERLLPASARSLGGARRFGPDVVARVRFVKQAQSAGLTLRDIQQLVGLQPGHGRAACQRIRTVLAGRLREIDARLDELQAFRTMLRDHLRTCDQALESGPHPECPALDALVR